MSDFHQNGFVTTIASLPSGDAITIDSRASVTCIIPALVSEFDHPAIFSILDTLESLESINEVIVVLDKASEEQYIFLKKQAKGKVTFFWKDAPQVALLCKQCNASDARGKGFNIWLGLGLALAKDNATHFITHDADIVNYDEQFVKKLLIPLTLPGLSFEFVKGYYPRVQKKLYGRVTRLLIAPLLIHLQQHQSSPFVDYLASFRYLLSGEAGWSKGLAYHLELEPMWGVELSLLSSAFKCLPSSSRAQVNLCDQYEHKHRKLKSCTVNDGLDEMAQQVTRALLGYCSHHGVHFPEQLEKSYNETASRLIQSYESVALCNGLSYCKKEEKECIDVFTKTIKKIAPSSITTLPSWDTVFKMHPEMKEYLKTIVQ